MKVIFLDFDGVLNSEGSFHYEDRRRKQWREQNLKGNVCETLCNVCTSNFQAVLDKYRDVNVVISSTWRETYTLEWLKEKLDSYHIDSSRVIGVTPKDDGGNRGLEIQTWLNNHPEVTQYVIIDDNDWGITPLHPWSSFVKTDWDSGMTWTHVQETFEKLKTRKKEKNESSEDK